MKNARTILALVVASLFATLSIACAQQDESLGIKNWVTTRMRMTTEAFNVLQADFKLTNRSGADISNISIVISYQKIEGDELKVTEPQVIEKLATGETKEIAVKTGDAPSFECYEIRLTYSDAGGEHKARWFGKGDQGQPSFLPAKLLEGEPRLALIGSALWFDKPNMPLQGVLRVRNLSATSVEQLSAKIYFTDGAIKNPRTVGTWSGRMGDGFLRAGEEKVVKLAIPLALAPKSFGGHHIEFSFAANEKPAEFAAWSGGEFTREATVEACQWNFQRDGNGLLIAAKIRNGLAQAVDAVTLQITFLKKDGGESRVVRRVELSFGELAAGANQDAETTLKNFKTPFDEIERKVFYRAKPATP